jgi:hypothetical protein
MRYYAVFLLFLVTEYVLRTFVHDFKYHAVGLFAEVGVLALTAAAGVFIASHCIRADRSFTAYAKVLLASIGGHIAAKIIGFFQWYWIISPKYRDVPGDMEEALEATVIFCIAGAIVIAICTAAGVAFVRTRNKP